jgi:D-3-phosphoglycerate dehydrogenase
MFKVLITDSLHEQGLEPLLNAPDINVSFRPGLAGEELLKEIETADALLVRSRTRVTAEVIGRGKRLKVIARAGAGVDNIDLAAATRAGVIVINAPGGNTVSTAEHAFAMMLALARHIPEANASLRRGEWKRNSFIGVELRGKTLAILGLGRVGTELAKRARAFDMHVIAHDPFLADERAEKLGVESVTFEEALSRADFLSVHTPLTRSTRHLINQSAFARMKDGVRLINCARGGIVDEEALLEAIRSGKVAGAALDVFEQEPPGDHPLLSLPQVIATPHLGASTDEAQESVARNVAEEVLSILRGEPFKNAVNLPAIPPEWQEKLKPYHELAEKLGSFVTQLATSAIKRVTVTFTGELARAETAPLTRTIIRGILSPHLANVNLVNALHLARERGITIIEQKTESLHGFTESITVQAETGKETLISSGTLLNGFGPRLIRLNAWPVDLTPEGHFLFIRHRDQPGVIGQVGTLLGAHDINIATMQVAREKAGGPAIMILKVDKPVSPDICAELEQLPELEKATVIEL